LTTGAQLLDDAAHRGGLITRAVERFNHVTDQIMEDRTNVEDTIIVKAVSVGISILQVLGNEPVSKL